MKTGSRGRIKTLR